MQRGLGQARAALRAHAEAHPGAVRSGVTKSEPNVSDGQPQVFIVGNAPNQRRIAFRRRAPVRSKSPGVVWLSGYRSDMDSTKATALDAEAERRGLGLLRFDYSGHGRSDGRLEDGTISRWLEETLALVRAQSEGPQIVVGSSMGGYLALLAARALNKAGETERVKGLILIAPAVDFTEALIWAKAPDEARRAIMDEGVWRQAFRLFERTRLLHSRPHRGRAQTPSPRRHDPHRRANRGAARHAGRRRAVFTCARADAALRRRSGNVDAGEGWRSPPVASTGLAIDVRRAGKDGMT